MEPPATKRFREKLKVFLEAPSKNRNFSERGKLFVTSEPELTRQFAIEQAERFIKSEERKHLKERNPEEEAQMQLLGEDFARLFNGPNHWLKLRDGRKKQLRDLTITGLRESAAVIRSHVTPRARMKAEYLESLADQMSPYALTHHGLKFGDYLELAAAGITPSR